MLNQACQGTRSYLRRRSLLQQAVVALAAAGTTGPAAALEVIRNGLTSSVTHGESPDLSVEDWEQIVWGYGRSMITEPPEALIVNLATDVAGLQLQIDRETNGSREKDLSRLSGQVAAMTAMSLTNLGQLSAAARWWFTARTAADASTDLSARAWVRGEEATYAVRANRPLQVCVDLADEAQAIGGVCAGATHALGGKAQALAMMGRATESTDSLRHLGEIFEKLPEAVTAERDSVFGWAEHCLRHTESIVHSYLGNFSEATEAQDRALGIYPAAPRARAFVHLYRAMCLVRGGVDDGMHHARQVIESLPAQHRTSQLLNCGHEVLNAIPAKERRRASVAELHELLAQPTVPNPN